MSDESDKVLSYRIEWGLLPLALQKALVELQATIVQVTDYTHCQITMSELRSGTPPYLDVMIHPEDRQM